MNAVKDFNYRLNSSVKTSSKSNIEFQNEINKILNQSIKITECNSNTLCIIGAGKMNDFSLPFLSGIYKHIILSDVDVISVESSLKDLGLNDSSKITTKEIEFTGFAEMAFFDIFKSKLLKVKSFNEIDNVIDSVLSEIAKYKFLEEYNGNCDLVYVSPIYTQLVYHQVLRECSVMRSKGYPEHYLKYIEEKMLQEMMGVINRFNNNIISLLSKNGQLLVLSDVFQLDSGSTFEKEVKSSIGNKDKMDLIYDEYQSKYGVGLGDFGLLDLDDKISSVSSKWLIWPFSNSTSFVVKVKVYKK